MQYLFIMSKYNTLNINNKSTLDQTNSAYISAFFRPFLFRIIIYFFQTRGGQRGGQPLTRGGPGPHLAAPLRTRHELEKGGGWVRG